MTAFEQWQQNRYGNYLPETEIDETEYDNAIKPGQPDSAAVKELADPAVHAEAAG